MRVQLLTDAAAVVNGNPFQMLRDSLSARVNQGVFQVSGIGTATVKLQGRADPNAPWVDVVSITSDSAQAVQLMREMRAIVSSWTSGTIEAWLNV